MVQTLQATNQMNEAKVPCPFPTCKGSMSIEWMQAEMGDKMIRKSTCSVCGTRSFIHVDMAAPSEDANLSYESGLKTLECGACHVKVSKVTLFRGMMICEYCQRNTEV